MAEPVKPMFDDIFEMPADDMLADLESINGEGVAIDVLREHNSEPIKATIRPSPFVQHTKRPMDAAELSKSLDDVSSTTSAHSVPLTHPIDYSKMF